MYIQYHTVAGLAPTSARTHNTLSLALRYNLPHCLVCEYLGGVVHTVGILYISTMVPTHSFPYSYLYTLVLYWQNIINDPSALPDFDRNCPCPEKCAEVCYSNMCDTYCYICISLYYCQLVQRCRSVVPSKRPTFVMIKKMLRQINPDQESPIDNMILMVG